MSKIKQQTLTLIALSLKLIYSLWKIKIILKK